jgi:hypothetical protein
MSSYRHLGTVHRALTLHWRRMVCDAIVAGNDNLPGVGGGTELWWDCWSEPARYHLELGRGCAYVRWVNAGQAGDLSAVICDGSTHPDQRGDGGDDTSTPAFIECGMGSILEQVGDWVWARVLGPLG